MSNKPLKTPIDKQVRRRLAEVVVDCIQDERELRQRIVLLEQMIHDAHYYVAYYKAINGTRFADQWLQRYWELSEVK